MAPYGVAFNSVYPWFSRRQDSIVATDPQVGEATGHVGFDNDEETVSKFYRDGELVSDDIGNTTGGFELPDAESPYRAEQTMTSTGYAGLATKLSAAWTFRSSRPATDDMVAPPVFAVRYRPTLDAPGSVRGRADDLPLSAQGNLVTESRCGP